MADPPGAAHRVAGRRDREEFLECAEVYGTGNWYGTLKSEVERARRQGGWALLEIDVQGALELMRKFPRALTIFLRTSSLFLAISDVWADAAKLTRRLARMANRTIGDLNIFVFWVPLE